MKEGHNKKIINYLDTLKKEDGVSGAAVGAAIGKNRQWATKIRKGTIKATREILIAIEKAFPQLLTEYKEGDDLEKTEYTKALEEIIRLERENKELELRNRELMNKIEKHKNKQK